jgi:hypothetical protein
VGVSTAMLPIVLVVLILGPMLVGLLARGRISARIGAEVTGTFEEGRRGTAVIAGIGQTGTRVNGMPRLSFTLVVTVPGETPYEAAARQVVPHAALGMLQPGRTVAVQVAAGDPGRVRIDLEATSLLVGTANLAEGAASGPVTRERSGAEVLARGTRVPMTIASVQDTGEASADGDPFCLIGLVLHEPGGDRPYVARHRVPAGIRTRVVAGATGEAAVDPHDPEVAAIDWATLPA